MKFTNKCLKTLTKTQVESMRILQFGLNNLLSFAIVGGKQSIKFLVTKCQSHRHTKSHHNEWKNIRVLIILCTPEDLKNVIMQTIQCTLPNLQVSNSSLPEENSPSEQFFYLTLKSLMGEKIPIISNYL